MASQFASGKIPTLTRKLNAGDSTAYMDSDVGVTSGRLYGNNNLQEEWIGFTGVSASGSEFAYTGLTRGLSQTADPSTASTGFTWLSGQSFALVEMHDQMMNRQRPDPVAFADTAARDAALGANGAATSPWTNVYVTATGFHYNYNLSTGQWEEVDTGTPTPNASTTVAGKVEIATQTEVDNSTDTGGTGATVSVIPSTFQTGITNRISDQATAEAGIDNTKVMTPLRVAQYCPSASDTVSGKSERATDAEFLAGTDATRFVTPAQAGASVKTGAPWSTMTVGNAPTERTTNSVTYVKLKEFVASYTGTYFTSFELSAGSSGADTANARIYKNGAAFGTERGRSTNTYTAFTEALSFTAGDLIQLYVKDQNGPTYSAKVQNFYLQAYVVTAGMETTMNTD